MTADEALASIRSLCVKIAEGDTGPYGGTCRDVDDPGEATVPMRWPWTKRGRELFRPYELAVVDAIRDSLPDEGANLLERQVAATELISRYIDDTYVDLYARRRGPDVRDPAVAFANRSPELRLATVGLSGSRGKGKVVVWAVNGHVFELYFSPSPKRLGRPAQITTTGVTIHANLMQPLEPVGHTQVSSLETVLRAELEGVWRDRPQWASVVADRDELYSVHVDETEYLVLAQLPDTTFLAGKLDPPAPGVTRFEPDGGPIAEYASLREAVAAGDIDRR